jgi:hypothetical protein
MFDLTGARVVITGAGAAWGARFASPLCGWGRRS